MNLTDSQVHAMLEIGGSEEAHGYIPQRVLNDLLSYQLIQCRSDAEVEFTPAGKEVYDELAGSAGKAVVTPADMNQVGPSQQ
jgi:hypothetical protein